MRTIGFSTGALALSDVSKALTMLQGQPVMAVELSALRFHELLPLMSMLPTLELSSYPYVSVHAPSRFDAGQEASVVDAMTKIAALGWRIVLHPDTIHDFGPWRQFGRLLAIENMDKRKPIGRTVDELLLIFDKLPEASFCFDIGHARQVDRTMHEAYFLLKEIGRRLVQLHVSEVNTRNGHDPLSVGSIRAFQKVAEWIPEDVPLILETPADTESIAWQIQMANEALALGVVTSTHGDPSC